MKSTFKQSRWWVYTIAFVMSLNGGYINSVTLVSILKNSVGYVTGNLTFAGDALQRGQYNLVFHLLFLVMCFLLGCMLSSLTIKNQNFKLDKRYMLSLVIQFILVLLAMVLLSLGSESASYLLAISMGVQNAMTTHYGSALIRTTHMTGTTTDLGIMLGRWIKGHSVEYWKMALYAVLISGFFIGTLFGAVMYAHVAALSLLFSLLIYLLMIGLQLFVSHNNVSA